MVLLDIEVGFVDVADLDGEVADGFRGVAEIINLIKEKAEVTGVFGFEEIVFVFLSYFF